MLLLLLLQGWTKAYEFSIGDLRAGAMVISEACSTMNKSSSATSNSLDWDTVHGLMEDAIYGGRVESTQDMRVLTAYLKRYFNAEVKLTCINAQ